MKRKYVFLAAVAASLAIGCTQVEEISSSGIIYSPTFYASFEDVGGMDTKTYVDNKLTMRWTKDDEVSIFVGNTLNQEYKYAGETGANNGSFNPLTTPGFYAADPLNANYAVYPFSNTNEMDADGGMSLILPAVQHYAENTFGLGANVMVAATKNTSDMMLQFRNLSGYLVLKLYGDETVKSITFEGNNGEKISGKAYVTAVSGYSPELDMDETGTTSITLDCGDGIPLGSTSATATEFWLCIPPTTFSDGFTITVTNTDGLSMIKSVASSRTIERNMKVSMVALETNCDTMLGNVEFEDANFKAYCVENFDTDGDGEISSEEALAVTVMSFDTNGMKNLEGVEYFQNLQYLNCSLTYYRGSRGADDGIWHFYDSNNVEVFGLESLDVSKNTSLTYLSCRYNQLTSLDLSKNTALTDLNCDYNLLTSLDLSKNTALTDLNCGNNQLTSLDVSKNTALTDLAFQYNHLTSLDVSGCTALTYLECDYNLLTSLDVSKNTALTDLAFQYNHLTSLDVSGCTALTRLWCNNNQLTSLDVSKNIAMTELICGGNQLTSLDVSNNTALARLWCNNNPYLTEIWFSKDQTIPSSFTYDTNIATIKRSGEPDAVDLGLSVKWATFNMGATKPEEYGDYYAWGETEPYYLYGYAQEDPQSHWRTGYGNMGYDKYKWEDSSNYSMMTKYDYSIDNNLTLDPEDDVAHVMWGDEWRMPTEYEWNELVDNCDFSWIDNYNGTGVKGTLVKSRINNATIFLPAAGARAFTILSELNEVGHYWSSSLYGGFYGGLYAMSGWSPSGTSSIFEVNGFLRQYGISVRPVYGEYISASSLSVQDISLKEGDVIDLTASILPANCSEKGIVWSSSDESIVTVSGKQLTGISAGTTILTASWVDDSSINATCTVTVYPHTPLPDGPVDLGLSVKWASCNIGATTPEGYGDYYAWGEIETYYEEGYAQEDPQNHWKSGHEDGYSSDLYGNVHATYKWFDDINYFIKYCTNPQSGIVDNKTVLELDDDVAYYKLGNNWRMPTDDEWNELINNCTWQWTMYNGVFGYRVSGNNNSIFLPAAGDRGGTVLFSGSIYWSSSLNTSSNHSAYTLWLSSGGYGISETPRTSGLSVRPVCE